ncbi:hypothetical protein GOBAR_AA09377 [Gossypium barbadense]|uniref:EF-hand domain-containing protein n=1 Tax=Gossypium barbadense TaxID=3634 RepID=A0A2P5Y6R5_GOSBA|nr:hypothetical protein GOBAR_AA09377 [Gossypium barbadense]
MRVVIIDGSTVKNFVTDEEHFNKSMDESFAALDLNEDGVCRNTIDPQEFKSEMKKILLAIADGLGSCPIQMALEDDDRSNFLKKAADLEAAKLVVNHGGGS